MATGTGAGVGSKGKGDRKSGSKPPPERAGAKPGVTKKKPFAGNKIRDKADRKDKFKEKRIWKKKGKKP